ncbi:COR domain-containing protein [Nostoc sp. UHCC 0870]|uniref:COR domain-containing protein n=1 Tax=Nostoc sp. UHCC 0870 TaxID=2914041 RepID=UPI001EDD8B9D|nr:COR domain-containing protein [Nostoc sp. UHCC 0870]UKO99865.1 leucine-rich repeat domain-containing protein [Nostoc sp. UHCC 0870]
MLITPQSVQQEIQEAKEKHLKKLDLSGLCLTEIPDEVFELEWLDILIVSCNQLTQIPEAITCLQNLTTLDLSDNGLTQIPEAITRLQNLTILDLRSNGLKQIPEAITRLQNLTTLNLSYNQLTQIPEAITRLQNLTTLYLLDNEITQIPEVITRLQNLTTLDLSYNQLKQIPEAITRLQNLTTLYLRDNEITQIPETITHLQNLTTLYLRDNYIKNAPLEVVEEGIDAIRDYFRQLADEGTNYLYEAKLLIVGEGGAGKTTLAKKIEDENYKMKEEDSTKGIEVIQWHFEIKTGQNFRVNIWDFGGQEIYHETHQFFLTKRSLYAVVADNRKEDTNFYYWLNVVELLSDNSPVLIIKNERQDRTREINEPQLRGHFSNLKETLATNFATNRGLPEVLREIKHHIASLPHIGAALPKTWVRVREALENESRNYISLDEYLQICQTHGFTQRKDKLQLSNYLHDLGVCLHFQDDPILNNIVILKPKWGTDAVYKVLDDKQVINNLGKFTWRDLQNIWQEEQYAAKQGELLQLMINFKLCYEIPNNPKNYIAPQLLTEKQPKYNWDKHNNLILRYTYDFMPKGIITQFIVSINQLIDQQKYVWKSGVILSQDQTKAEIIEYYDQRKIKIRVTGLHKRDLLTCVTHEINKIHASYKQLKFDKLIPCNCSVCKNQQNPHFYKFDNLRNRIAKQKYDVECDISFEKVNVLQLIDDVMDKNQLNQEEKQRQNSNVTHIYNQINANTLKLQQGNNIMNQPPDSEEKSKPQEEVKLSFAFRNGMFYLFIFVVVFCLMTFFGGTLPFHYLVLIILGTAIFIILIGVLQLRQDDRLSETSFVKLIKMVLKQFPLIGNFIEMFQRK